MVASAVSLRSPRAKGFLSLFGRACGQNLPSDEILQSAVDAVARSMGTDVATLYIYDGRAGDLVLAATRGLPRSAVGFVTLKPGEGVSGRAAMDRTAIAAPDVSIAPDFKAIAGFDQSGYRSILAVPVVTQGRLIGVLNVQTVAVNHYTPRDIQDLTAIAGGLAPVLDELLAGDMRLRLRGPSVLAELDGIAAAAQGGTEICRRIVDRLRLLFAGAQCAVASFDDAGAQTLVGDVIDQSQREALERVMACGTPETASAEHGGPLLVLPIAGSSGTLGAILIGADSDGGRTSFGTYEAEYVEALAAQAGVALDRNSRPPPSRSEESVPSTMLSQFDELTRMVLDDAGLEALVIRIGELCGSAVAVVDASGSVIAGAKPDVIEHSVDLCAAESYMGRVVTGRLPRGQETLTATARVLALELSKWKVRFEVEARLRGDLLEVLTSGSWQDERQACTRAGLAGIDLTRTYVPVMFIIDTAALTERRGALALRSFERAVRRLCGEPPHCVLFFRPDGILVLIDACGQRTGSMTAVEQVLAELRTLAGDIPTAAGIGAACCRLAQYGTSVRQANMAARLGLRMHASLPVEAARLGAFRLLLALEDEAPMRAFVDDNLGPLLQPDTEGYGPELVRTLEAFYASGERLRPAADALYVHVNTLKYRLSRIETLTARDLNNPSDRLGLYLALYALRLLEPERQSLLPNNIGAPSLSPSHDVN